MPYKLVDEKTRKVVTLPATRRDFRGHPETIVRFSPPDDYPRQSGYVYTKEDWRYYPQVFGLKIVFTHTRKRK